MDIRNEKGTHYSVYLFKGIAVKFPLEKEDERKMKHIVDCQNELAKELKSVLPAVVLEDICMVMPEAPGTRVDKINSQKNHIRNLIQKEREKIEELGYEISDTTDKNVYYNRTEDQIYLIDFSQIKKQ